MNGEHAVELTAQWALWGADAEDSTYRVLASSAGDLTEWDFEDMVGRYGVGTPDRLPQYTVFWFPDAGGRPWFVGLAIQEYASYAPHDERSRYDASGREITFSRLFCVRYADLAAHGVTFTELLNAAEQQLPTGVRVDPVTLRVREERSRPPLAPCPATAPPDLAEMVATLLLTSRQVCVLGADEIPAVERLAFIDRVMSLLPFGMRATLSAATWASPTARDLKLRLFFTGARRDDGGTRHMRWGQRGWGQEKAPDGEIVRQYLDWVRQAGARAPDLLEQQTAPARFSAADLAAMIGALPKNLTVANILRDVSDSLGDGDSAGAMTELRRLKPYKARSVPAADREQYRNQVLRSGLLDSHQGLPPGADKESLYRTLLQLAFEFPLCYDDYCTIEDAVGGPPRGKLRLALLDLKFAGFVPRLLASQGEPRFTDEELIKVLDDEDTPADGPLNELQRDLAGIRREHRAPAYDFAVLYLRTYAPDPRAELARRGYLADILAAAFPGEPGEQQPRLQYLLRFTHGERLSRGQIRDLFTEPDLRPTPAFEAVVARLASSPATGPLIAQLAVDARTRQAENDKRAAGDADAGPDHGVQAWHRVLRRLTSGGKPRE